MGFWDPSFIAQRGTTLAHLRAMSTTYENALVPFQTPDPFGGGAVRHSSWVPNQEGRGAFDGMLRVALWVVTALAAVVVVTVAGELGRRGVTQVLRVQERQEALRPRTEVI